MRLFKGHMFLGLIILGLSVLGCNNHDFQDVEQTEVITITANVPNELETRVDFDKRKFDIYWNSDDAFQVYSATSSGHKFHHTGTDGAGRDKFEGVRPFGSELYAFYPASKSNNSGLNDDFFDYTGQTQTGNDNVDDLSEYLYMVGTVNTSNYSVSDFALQPSVLKLTINMPDDFVGDVASVSIKLADTKFHTKKHVIGSHDLESDDALTMSMSLSSVTLRKGQQLVVYMAISPLSVFNDVFTLTVVDTDGSQYESTIDNFTYDFKKAMVCPAILTVEKKINAVTSLLALHDTYDETMATLPLSSSSRINTEDITLRGLVSYIDSKGFYITDGTAGIYCYKSPTELENLKIGDEYTVKPSHLGKFRSMMARISGGMYYDVNDRLMVVDAEYFKEDPTIDLESVRVDVTIAEILNTTDDHYYGMFVRLVDVYSDKLDLSTGAKIGKDGNWLPTIYNDNLPVLSSYVHTIDASATIVYFINKPYLKLHGYTTESGFIKIDLATLHARYYDILEPSSTISLSNVVVHGVVSYKDENGFYITDGTGGLYCYSSPRDVNVGDVYTIKPSVLTNNLGLNVGAYYFTRSIISLYIGDYIQDKTSSLNLDSVKFDWVTSETPVVDDDRYIGMYMTIHDVTSNRFLDWSDPMVLTDGTYTWYTYKNYYGLEPLTSRHQIFDVTGPYILDGKKRRIQVKKVSNIHY